MILTYHKIDIKSKDENTVSLFIFFMQLLVLKITNKKSVLLENYDMNNKSHFVIRFDDVDKKTLKYAIPVLRIFKYLAEFFVCEDFVLSGGNYWADINNLKKIVSLGHRLEYHSKSHKNLIEIEQEKLLEKEIKTPDALKIIDKNSFKYFAYPYWKYNDKIISIVMKYFNGALSGNGFSNQTIWAMDSIKMKNTLVMRNK